MSQFVFTPPFCRAALLGAPLVSIVMEMTVPFVMHLVRISFVVTAARATFVKIHYVPIVLIRVYAQRAHLTRF